MIRIIEKGAIPDQVHRATCGCCSTIFEYNKRAIVEKCERSYFSGPRQVQCPVCSKQILLNILYEQI